MPALPLCQVPVQQPSPAAQPGPVPQAMSPAASQPRLVPSHASSGTQPSLACSLIASGSLVGAPCHMDPAVRASSPQLVRPAEPWDADEGPPQVGAGVRAPSATRPPPEILTSRPSIDSSRSVESLRAWPQEPVARSQSPATDRSWDGGGPQTLLVLQQQPSLRLPSQPSLSHAVPQPSQVQQLQFHPSIQGSGSDRECEKLAWSRTGAKGEGVPPLVHQDSQPEVEVTPRDGVQQRRRSRIMPAPQRTRSPTVRESGHVGRAVSGSGSLCAPLEVSQPTPRGVGRRVTSPMHPSSRRVTSPVGAERVLRSVASSSCPGNVVGAAAMPHMSSCKPGALQRGSMARGLGSPKDSASSPKQHPISAACAKSLSRAFDPKLPQTSARHRHTIGEIR